MRRRSFAALSATQVSSPQQPMLRLARALPISVSPVQRFDQFGQVQSIVISCSFHSELEDTRNVFVDETLVVGLQSLHVRNFRALGVQVEDAERQINFII